MVVCSARLQGNRWVLLRKNFYFPRYERQWSVRLNVFLTSCSLVACRQLISVEFELDLLVSVSVNNIMVTIGRKNMKAIAFKRHQQINLIFV